MGGGGLLPADQRVVLRLGQGQGEGAGEGRRRGPTLLEAQLGHLGRERRDGTDTGKPLDLKGTIMYRGAFGLLNYGYQKGIRKGIQIEGKIYNVNEDPKDAAPYCDGVGAL